MNINDKQLGIRLSEKLDAKLRQFQIRRFPDKSLGWLVRRILVQFLRTFDGDDYLD